MDAPFSEPREWAECSHCRDGDREYHPTLSALAPCPVCGQPPRCQTGSRTDRQCSRPGTVQPLLTSSGYVICGQHYRDWEARAILEDWEQARTFLELFCRQSEEIGCRALSEALDLAWAEAEMRIAGAEAELRMIWDE